MLTRRRFVELPVGVLYPIFRQNLWPIAGLFRFRRTRFQVSRKLFEES
jgi:hypothetical protein